MISIELNAFAQLQLVKDINTDIVPDDANPEQLILFKGKIYFAATDYRGSELWSTSGNAPGTILVKDINAGANSSNPSEFCAVDDVLYFTAADSAHGTELWRTDGTSGGTYLVKDTESGEFSGCNSTNGMIAIDGKLYFVAKGANGTMDVWVSDGTTAGTQTLNPFSTNGTPNYFQNLNGKLVYSENNQVWIYDGINPAIVVYTVPSGFINSVVVHGDYAFFCGQYSTFGSELMKSDGTIAGTGLVKDIWPGSSSSSVSNMISLNGMLLFSAIDGINGRELWTSDGTTAGTYMIKDIAPGDIGPSNPYSSVPQDFTAAESYIYFQAYTPNEGRELWRTDGTAPGTVLVKDINTGIGYSKPADFFYLDGTLYFQAFDSLHGIELWSTQPSALGASLVKDIYPGDESSEPEYLVALNNKVFFAATTLDQGRELCKSNGIVTGTKLVKDIYGPTLSSADLDDDNYAVMNGNYFFVANEGVKGYELWKSDGTSAGTKMVKNIYPGGVTDFTSPYYITNIAGTIYFGGNDSIHGYELWRSDGTAAGTKMVKDIAPGTESSFPALFCEVGDLLFFQAFDPIHGTELWKSDGTSAGTKIVKDINPGVLSSDPSELYNYNGVLYFGAGTENEGRELWKSNGTAFGTKLIKDINGSNESSEILDVKSLGNIIVFSYRFGDYPYSGGLYKTNGTPAGTVLISAGQFTSTRASNGYLYFSGKTGSPPDYELWRTDGNTAELFYSISSGTSSSLPYLFADLNGVLLFSADGVGGRELYRTDGTIAGTYILKDIQPGSISSNPDDLKVIDSVAVFMAYTADHGVEPYRTNGTTAGTYLIGEVVPGSSGNIFQEPNFGNVGNAVLFFTNDLIHGYELWKIESPFRILEDTLCVESNLSLDAVVAPNPFSNTCNLYITGEMLEKVTVTISTITGTLVDKFITNCGTTVEIGRDLTAGVYLVQLKQAINTRVLKLIKTD